jgi:hypothetical protein
LPSSGIIEATTSERSPIRRRTAARYALGVTAGHHMAKVISGVAPVLSSRLPFVSLLECVKSTLGGSHEY